MIPPAPAGRVRAAVAVAAHQEGGDLDHHLEDRARADPEANRHPVRVDRLRADNDPDRGR